MADRDNQRAFLEAISNAVRRKQAGEDPEANPSPPMPRFLPPTNPNDVQVAPPKPDPEAMANVQIGNAANAAPMADPRKVMNPLTGLPMSASSPQLSADDQARIQQQADKVEMMKQFYKNKANGGQ